MKKTQKTKSWKYQIDILKTIQVSQTLQYTEMIFSSVFVRNQSSWVDLHKENDWHERLYDKNWTYWTTLASFLPSVIESMLCLFLPSRIKQGSIYQFIPHTRDGRGDDTILLWTPYLFINNILWECNCWIAPMFKPLTFYLVNIDKSVKLNWSKRLLK